MERNESMGEEATGSTDRTRPAEGELTMTQSHTPTPWRSSKVNGVWYVVNSTGGQIASTDGERQANRIAEALSSHDALMAALRAIINTNPVADYVLDIHALAIRNIARAALAAAEGE